MVAAGTLGMVHYGAHGLPGTGGAVAHRVTDALRAAGRGESEVVMPVPLVEPGAFLIVVDLVVQLVDLAGIRYHILVERHPVDVGIAPIHIRLAVVVDEDSGIDVLPVLFLPYERFPERIHEGSVRAVSDKHSDAVPVDGAVHIELAVPLRDLQGPGAVVAVIPVETAERGHRAVVGPVDHVRRGVEQPVEHAEASSGIIGVMRCIKIDRAVIHHRSGVRGVFRLDNGHVDIVVELPPVEVEELSLSALEKDEQVVLAGNVPADGGSLDGILAEYVEPDEGIPFDLVQVELYPALAPDAERLDRNEASGLLSKINRTDLDPVAVIDAGDTESPAREPFSLDSFGSYHSPGLDVQVRIDRALGGRRIRRRDDGTLRPQGQGDRHHGHE